MKATLSLAAVAVVAVFGAACASTDVVPGQYDTAIVYPNITLQSPELQRSLGFQEPVVSETESGLMRVTVPVRSRRNQEIHLQYKVIWLDADGNPIRPEMNWRYRRMEPLQPAYLSASATSETAENYNMQIRWGRQ